MLGLDKEAPPVPTDVRLVAISLSAWQWAKVLAAIALGQLILAGIGLLLTVAAVGMLRG